MYVYAIVESSKKEHLRQWNKVVAGRLHPSALLARLVRIKAKQIILVAVLRIKDFFTSNYKQQAHVPACVLGFLNKRHTLFLSVERRCIHHTWPSPTTELSSLLIEQEFVRALARHAGGDGGESVLDKFEVRQSEGAQPGADLSWVARAALSVSLRMNNTEQARESRRLHVTSLCAKSNYDGSEYNVNLDLDFTFYLSVSIHPRLSAAGLVKFIWSLSIR